MALACPCGLAPPRPHPVSFRFLNFKAPKGVQAGKGQPCLIIRLENLRFAREITRVGSHRSIPTLHVLIPSMHSRPVPASAKTTYYWRKHIPRRHAHCGRVDSQVACAHPRLDMWIRNMYFCHCIFCEELRFQSQTLAKSVQSPIQNFIMPTLSMPHTFF